MKPEIQAKHHLDQAYAYYEDSEELEKALMECDVALELDPYLVEAHNLRGILLEELGRPTEAIKAYKQAIQLDPSFTEAKDNLSDLKSDLARGSRLVTIARFTFPGEADVLKSKLEAEGIWSFIGGVDNVAITSGGILQVKEEDVEKALEILDQEGEEI
jgi:tetratricopeptide (TPR) repeat protein